MRVASVEVLKKHILMLEPEDDHSILDCIRTYQQVASCTVMSENADRIQQLRGRFGFYHDIEIKLLSASTLESYLGKHIESKPSPLICLATEKAKAFKAAVLKKLPDTKMVGDRAQLASNFTALDSEPIQIVTAANDSFRWWYDQLAYSASLLHYPIEIYDLGNLGFGLPYQSEVPLHPDGYYKVIDQKWKSKALHKPDILADYLKHHSGFTVYLDADIYVYQDIHEIVNAANGHYDVGVTVRSELEMRKNASKNNHKYTGYLNAGVAFFKPTEQAKAFVATWQEKTKELGNDQMALNELVNPTQLELKPGDTLLQNGCRIHLFQGEVYNFDYHLDSELKGHEKIMHFKNSKDRVLHFEEFLSEKNTNSILDELIANLPSDWAHRDSLIRQFHTLRSEGRRVRAMLNKDRTRWLKQRTKLFSLIDSLKSTLIEGGE